MGYKHTLSPEQANTQFQAGQAGSLGLFSTNAILYGGMARQTRSKAFGIISLINAAGAIGTLFDKREGSWNHAKKQTRKGKYFKTDKSPKAVWFWGPAAGKFTDKAK